MVVCDGIVPELVGIDRFIYITTKDRISISISTGLTGRSIVFVVSAGEETEKNECVHYGSLVLLFIAYIFVTVFSVNGSLVHQYWQSFYLLSLRVLYDPTAAKVRRFRMLCT